MAREDTPSNPHTEDIEAHESSADVTPRAEDVAQEDVVDDPHLEDAGAHEHALVVATNPEDVAQGDSIDDLYTDDVESQNPAVNALPSPEVTSQEDLIDDLYVDDTKAHEVLAGATPYPENATQEDLVDDLYIDDAEAQECPLGIISTTQDAVVEGSVDDLNTGNAEGQEFSADDMSDSDDDLAFLESNKFVNIVMTTVTDFLNRQRAHQPPSPSGSEVKRDSTESRATFMHETGSDESGCSNDEGGNSADEIDDAEVLSNRPSFNVAQALEKINLPSSSWAELAGSSIERSVVLTKLRCEFLTRALERSWFDDTTYSWLYVRCMH